MEDYAVRIPHSLTPNVSIIPFFNILTQLSYSVMWPLNDISYGGAVELNIIIIFIDIFRNIIKEQNTLTCDIRA